MARQFLGDAVELAGDPGKAASRSAAVVIRTRHASGRAALAAGVELCHEFAVGGSGGFQLSVAVFEFGGTVE